MQIVLIVLFVLGYYFPVIYSVAQLLFAVDMVVLVIDFWLLFGQKGYVEVQRHAQDRLSNGDVNTINLSIQSHYRIPVSLVILDELPDQLQIRDFEMTLDLKPGVLCDLSYDIIPKTRGEYHFGVTNVLVSSLLGMIQKREKAGEEVTIRVYPSFIHINQLELAAISQQLQVQGQKRVQKVGNSQEFDSIRSYVLGDDPRHINWKATARKNTLQVNHFTDEKSQGVYCLLDKSRSMQMPFEGMTLLDYAINATLVLSHVALRKGDRAGLISFEGEPSSFVKANRQANQIHKLMEALYHEQTSFSEVDYTSLYTFCHKNINQRSLCLLFTNFESKHSLERQLPYLKMLNRQHLLLVIFFRNTEVDLVMEEESSSIEGIYQKAIAAQMIREKELIHEKLHHAGILSLYTTPQNLSVEVLNRYIQIKNRRVL
ncbi:MAG: DUF58 domain-containing protein [Cytophagales bacterium]|nr:DUF58 domain-containing protein [Cytophagales bacterium]